MKGHHIRGRGCALALAIVLLVAAHAVLLGVASKLHYSVVLVGVVVGIAGLKYAWWKLRR